MSYRNGARCWCMCMGFWLLMTAYFGYHHYLAEMFGSAGLTLACLWLTTIYDRYDYEEAKDVKQRRNASRSDESQP